MLIEEHIKRTNEEILERISKLEEKLYSFQIDLNVIKGSVIMVSTPKGNTNFLHDKFKEQEMDDPNVGVLS